ncbi:hypothetical protein K439DRAFT_1615898 [Ramaria rubella]|nr:hypothetical protein K439DRAFT_1615898 [Ramaria rubella]
MIFITGTRIPIPAEVYEGDKWWEWENAPSLYKPQGRKGRKGSRCFTDSDKEEVLEQTNPSKKPKVSSKGKQPEVLGSSDHEEEDDIVLMETETDEPLPEPKLLLQCIGDVSLCQSPKITPTPLFLEDEHSSELCLPSLCPPSTAPVASTSLTKLSDTNCANRKPYQALFPMDRDLWDEPVPLGNISF